MGGGKILPLLHQSTRRTLASVLECGVGDHITRTYDVLSVCSRYVLVRILSLYICDAGMTREVENLIKDNNELLATK